MQHFLILFLNINFSTIKLKAFTKRKTSYHNSIKYLQPSLYSLAVLDCMAWRLSWRYSASKKSAFVKCSGLLQEILFISSQKNLSYSLQLHLRSLHPLHGITCTNGCRIILTGLI